MDQIGLAQHVEKLLLRHSLPLANDFRFHEGDVRGGASETDGAQFQEERGELAQAGTERCGWRIVGFLWLIHAELVVPSREAARVQRRLFRLDPGIPRQSKRAGHISMAKSVRVSLTLNQNLCPA